MKEPERLALLSSADTDSWTYPLWNEIRQRSDVFPHAAAWANARFDLSPSGETEYVDGVWVSGGFFDTFGIQPLAGRLITDADDRRNGGADGPVAVISDSFSQRHFGQAASPIGQRISLDRVSFTIVGMTAFHGAEVGRAFDVAVPIGCVRRRSLAGRHA